MGKQVLTPRFYVDIPTFLHATGDLHWADSPRGAAGLYMNPSNPYVYNPTEAWTFKIGNFSNTAKTSFPINFVALLNHNLAADAPFKVKGIHNTAMGIQQWPNLTGSTYYKVNILNANLNATADKLSLAYNGTTIFELNNPNNQLDEYWNFFGIEYADFDFDLESHQLGSFVVGKYWDAPNSPDLNLTMERRFDGIKRQKTIGGKTLANIYYDGPTEWTMNNRHSDAYPSQVYKYPPFELDLTTQGAAAPGNEPAFNQRAKSGLGRKGLRSWNLTFSYISEDDMWMKNEVSNTLISDSESNPDLNDPNPMLSDDSFNFVWNCTLGGTLPFIFQPNAPKYDSAGVMTQGDNSPDQFSICTFRDNTLSVTQVASNVYTLNITIDEVA